MFLPERTTMKRTFNRRRGRDLPSNPKSISDLGEIPEEFRRTLGRKAFLIYDSYDDEESDDEDDEERRRQNRILVFASKDALVKLSRSKIWQIDGTFETAPEIFTQILTIHGDYRNEMLPLVYALLPDKREDSYRRAILAVTDSCERLHIRMPDPSLIVSDFEKGIINAAKAEFPDANVRLCLFHLRQAAYRHIQSLGLQTAYRDPEDSSVRDAFRTCVGVAFVPTEDVIDSFMEARAEMPATMNRFADYFEKTYIMPRRPRGQRAPAAPRYPPHQWNQHQAARRNEPRTNNATEAWHNRFQVKINKVKDTAYDLYE